MAQTHDIAAEHCGNFILSQIRADNSSYRQIFSNSLHRIGDFRWPRPDYVCFDEEKKISYALEFKPLMQSKREYVCGLGQSITYLQHHNYSGLIIPEYADDGFPIADFMLDVFNSEPLLNSYVSLFSYNQNLDVSIRRGISRERTDVVNIGDIENKTFWCWWRDMSHYELLALLELSFKYYKETGDIYTNFIYPEFVSMYRKGQCLTFEGQPRKTPTEKSIKSFKQNYRIPFEQLGLWTSKEGRLSDLGMRLLTIGVKYGAESKNFRDAIAYLLLTVGKHLDLIHIVSDIQDKFDIPKTSEEFKVLLDKELSERGMIGKRKPTAVTTNAKGSYIRDEFKLWNKFGLIKGNSSRYFEPYVGLSFDWGRITELLSNNSLNNELIL